MSQSDSKQVLENTLVQTVDQFPFQEGPINLAAGFGRHDRPTGSCPSWLPNWFCTPISDIIKGDAGMAKTPDPVNKGPKPVDKRTTRSTSHKTGPKTPSRGNTPKGSTPKGTKPQPKNKPGPNVKVGGTSNIGGLVNTQNVRATQDEITTYAVVYPYSVDLFQYVANLYPAGDATTTDSIARTYFESATGVKLLIDINTALRKTNTITVDHVADYINTVTQAYHFLLSVRNHLSLCYSTAYHNSLNIRLNDVYDERVLPLHQELASALQVHRLPPEVTKLVQSLSEVYSTGPDGQSTLLQIIPENFNDLSTLESQFITHVGNVSTTSLTNMVDIITAFKSERYPGSVLKMEPLVLEPLVSDGDTYLKHYKPKYSRNFLNLWSNLPFHATNAGSTRITAFDVADHVTNFTRFVYTDEYTFDISALTPTYVTADARYQPGLLEPASISGPSNSRMRYINGNGDIITVNNTGYGSYAFGALCMNGYYCYNQTDQVAVRIPGNAMVVSNVREVGQDCRKMVRLLNGIPFGK